MYLHIPQVEALSESVSVNRTRLTSWNWHADYAKRGREGTLALRACTVDVDVREHIRGRKLQISGSRPVCAPRSRPNGVPGCKGASVPGVEVGLTVTAAVEIICICLYSRISVNDARRRTPKERGRRYRSLTTCAP